MNYQEARDKLIWNLRLDYDPVGILFVMDESEVENLPVTHEAKGKLTYCQFLAAVRQERYALFMRPERLLCPNASLVFGFREPKKEAEIKQHLKYLGDPELSWEAARQKEKLKLGVCRGVYVAPLDYFDGIGKDPDVVLMVCVPYQAYHILNDYMAAMKKPNLTFFHTPNSAVCSGSVYCFNQQSPNMTTMCAGSKTSGKTEMNYVNVFIPGTHLLPTVEAQLKRCEQGGPSVLGKGNVPWPGLDVCKSCPLFKFVPVEK